MCICSVLEFDYFDRYRKLFPQLVFLFLILFPVRYGLAQCWESAGRSYGIDPILLKAIAWKESRGDDQAIGPLLSDGNRALGLMQINSIHLPALARFGIRREHLFDACISQKVGAWILADCISRFGPYWKAVGCYNTGPASKNTIAQDAYVRDVRVFYSAYSKSKIQ
jgi:soluble lytic murein transglycosylase-like protein